MVLYYAAVQYIYCTRQRSPRQVRSLAEQSSAQRVGTSVHSRGQVNLFIAQQKEMQRNTMESAILQHTNIQQIPMQQSAGQYGTMHQRVVMQNPADIIDELLSPLSVEHDQVLPNLPVPPPPELEPLSSHEAAHVDALAQLHLLLNQSPPSPGQLQPVSAQRQYCSGPAQFPHLHPAAVAAATAVASSRKVEHGVHTTASFRPAANVEVPAKITTFGVAAGSVVKPTAKRTPRVRRYSRAKPSKFCHVCARSGDIMELAPCKNVQFGVCRKAVCEKCFGEQGWDWVAAKEQPDGFSCCHCRRDCPANAQCRTYQKTNERRRVTCMKKRMLVEDTLANGGDVEAILKQNGLL